MRDNLEVFSRKDLCLMVLLKKLGEEVAACLAQGFGGVITRMTREQAD